MDRDGDLFRGGLKKISLSGAMCLCEEQSGFTGNAGQNDMAVMKSKRFLSLPRSGAMTLARRFNAGAEGEIERRRVSGD